MCHIFQANQAQKLYFNVIQFFNHNDKYDFLSFPTVFEIYEYMDIMLEWTFTLVNFELERKVRVLINNFWVICFLYVISFCCR